MQVRLVSHASVVIASDDATIWTDPWVAGTAFNNSWRLLGPVTPMDPIALADIQYLWISHEHPDHFHIPTLRALPDDFKRRVTVLFQENNSTKIFDAMRRMGFSNQLPLPHRTRVTLTPNTSVYCYQVGQMDSALCVIFGGHSILNVNDAECSRSDCRIIRADVGPPDVVLNQFSVAGYTGHLDRDARLPMMAQRVLDNMVANHVDLGARTSVPIASFMYFASRDNAYMNKFANTPQRAYNHFKGVGCDLDVLFLGETLNVTAPRKESERCASIQRWDDVYIELPSLPLEPPVEVSLDRIRDGFKRRAADLRSKYPSVILRGLGSLSVWVPDLGQAIKFSLRSGLFEDVDLEESACDATVNSQPLDFLFREPFGLQTLGVSARYTVRSSYRRWKAHRILFALDNAEVYLRLGRILTRSNIRHVASRSRGATRQLVYQVRRMR